MTHQIKFSEDIVPLSDLKLNPSRIVNQVDKTHRTVLLTNRGRGVAIMQSLKDYEEEMERKLFLQNIVIGLLDFETEQTMDLSKVKQRLGLN